MTLGVGWEVIFSTPDHHHDVVEPGRDRRNGMEKRRPARRAGRFNARGWNAVDSQRGRDVGRQMVLAHEGGSGEISEVERFDLPGSKTYGVRRT